MAYQNTARQAGGGDQKQYKKESDYDKAKVVTALNQIREQYARTLARHGLHTEQEIAFLWAILTSNLNLLEKACQEPEQFKRALLMQASIGLTLDPSRAYAYLVVRKTKLILDVGYRGLIKIAVDEGLIKTAKPELVHAQDRFEYKGPSAAPVHTNANFFGERGPVVGGYVIATLPDGTVMVETMTESEFQEIALLNPSSDAWKKEFSKGEMRKKTVLKRASKWWYNSAVSGADSGRLQSAISYLNEEAGEGIPQATTEPAEPQVPADDQVPETVKTRVAQILVRAQKQGAWKPCADYMSEKFKGKELTWALDQLKKAETEATNADSGPDSEPPPAGPDPDQ
ncbi:MAG: recombinase RecT [Gammaproteobacteria bacterium]|nr:recombinase RecT [Gammaproteobacteria bacterium]MBU1655192.1 recombinase RecT [Gammaproteobacteria bacterium]MBU1960003.1 recombinase RecT [Gammaproteobacteria bacterium]